MNEKFLEDYYANPLQTMNSLVSSVAKNAVESAMQPFMSQVQPVVRAHEESIQTQKWNQQTNAVAQAHPEEFEGLKPLMSQVINDQNEIINALPDNINKVEYIFNQAKAIDAQQKQASLQAQIRTPEQMLADPAFLQSIMQNEQIKQMFAQSQVEAIEAVATVLCHIQGRRYLTCYAAIPRLLFFPAEHALPIFPSISSIW